MPWIVCLVVWVKTFVLSAAQALLRHAIAGSLLLKVQILTLRRCVYRSAVFREPLGFSCVSRSRANRSARMRVLTGIATLQLHFSKMYSPSRQIKTDGGNLNLLSQNVNLRGGIIQLRPEQSLLIEEFLAMRNNGFQEKIRKCVSAFIKEALNKLSLCEIRLSVTTQ